MWRSSCGSISGDCCITADDSPGGSITGGGIGGGRGGSLCGGSCRGSDSAGVCSSSSILSIRSNGASTGTSTCSCGSASNSISSLMRTTIAATTSGSYADGGSSVGGIAVYP